MVVALLITQSLFLTSSAVNNGDDANAALTNTATGATSVMNSGDGANDPIQLLDADGNADAADDGVHRQDDIDGGKGVAAHKAGDKNPVHRRVQGGENQHDDGRDGKTEKGKKGKLLGKCCRSYAGCSLTFDLT